MTPPLNKYLGHRELVLRENARTNTERAARIMALRERTVKR
jgi:hypothetical protein